MNLDDVALKQLTTVINEPWYRSGPYLVELFNSYGARDVYSKGFPSRKDYTFQKLKNINNTKQIENLINYVMHSREYLEAADFDFYTEIVQPITKIIYHCGYSVQKNAKNEYIVTGDGLIEEENIELKPTFENIQQNILEEINKAQFLIWISVAWFTDKTLFSALKIKQSQGVNVQILLNNDSINNNTGIDFENYFETYRKNPFGYYSNNIFHQKFCVIDLRTTITGTYNWTNKAMYNHEDINIIYSSETAQTYAKRFIENKLFQ